MPVVAVVLHFHPPAQLGVVCLRVDKPGVCIFGAFNFFGGDYIALWTDHPIRSHTSALPSLAGLIRRFPRGAGYAKTPQDRRRDVAGFYVPALTGCQCEDGPVQ